MKLFVPLLTSMMLTLCGMVLGYGMLMSLGMGLHGAKGWGFLHLDWILQTHLSYWVAHMKNLSILLIVSVFFSGVLRKI